MPLLFSFAFRPLFILVVLQAIIHIALWYALWNGMLTSSMEFSPIYWHGHEMAIGFAGAAIAGFLLTAVATWTGRPQVQGWPLVLLCSNWLLARLGLMAPAVSAAAGIFYWLCLLMLMAREVMSAANTRNYKVLLILLGFLILESVFQYSLLTQSALLRQVLWSQIFLVVVMINLIGGRIIPAFTRNWLLKRRGTLSEDRLPAAFGTVDIAATLLLIVFFLATLAALDGGLILPLAIGTFVLQAWRLIRWKGYSCLSDPLVWMMHLSYAWIPIGALLVGLGQAGYISISAGIHALTIGTVACMIISVASRAALGHTGRPLQAHPLLTASVILIALSALSRVGASMLASDFLLTSSTVLWIGGFISFAIRYIPVLYLPALDQDP